MPTNGGPQHGLSVASQGSTVQGLTINRFPCNGISLGAGNNLIRGNYIGTDATGTFDRGNGVGIFIADGANGNVIGGTTGLDRNVISGNGPATLCPGGASGIWVQSNRNRIQGNYIGTNAAGTASVGNLVRGIDSRGIVTNSGGNNVIGGTSPGAGNLISGNGSYGIYAGNLGNRIQGNRVGTNASGTSGIPNDPNGIFVGHLGTVIGGLAPNTIAFNQGNGIQVPTGPGPGALATIRRNAIFANGQLGIDLKTDGVTANDVGDGDGGPNGLQNYPVLTSVVRNGGNFDIAGTLNSTANTTFLLEFFSNAGCDPSGFGEGQRYLGSLLAATDGTGNASFATSFVAPVPGDRWFTSTATGPGGNTSEFSQCLQRPLTSDLAIQKSDSADPVPAGETFTYQLLVTTSRGSEGATGVSVFDQVPDTLTIQSVTSSRGDCVVDGQDVTCDLGNANRLSETIDITVLTSDPARLVNTASVSSTSFDPNPVNNEDTEQTTVG